MSYVRFVPGFTRHPKRIKSGPVSSWLWACSVDYCMIHLTDGFLDEAAVPTLCSNITPNALKRATENLLAVGSWERVPGGFKVHDYLRHNLSKAQVEADQEAGRQRYQKWKGNQRRDNAVATALDNGATTPKQHDSLSVCRSDVTTHYSEGPIAHAMGSNGAQPEDASTKRDRSLALLAHATGRTVDQLRAEMDATKERPN